MRHRRSKSMALGWPGDETKKVSKCSLEARE